jgi:scavenger receptor class B, member 1
MIFPNIPHLLNIQQFQIKRGKYLFNVWQKPPVDVILSIYLFNATNANEFMSGKDKKLKLEEIGPYVYQ